MKRLVVCLLAVLVLVSIEPAFGAAIRDLPGFKAKSLGPQDEYAEFDAIGFPINFFGRSYTQVWVNNNGALTLAERLFGWQPQLMRGTAREIIAPFLADVDTRRDGSKPVTYGRDTVNGRNAFGVNYVKVAFYSRESFATALNSFQVILIDRTDTGPGNFDIEFNYDQIKWESGQENGGGLIGQGGATAVAGYSAGQGVDSGKYYDLEGSLVPGSFLDTGRRPLIRNSLNSAVLGRYIFASRNGAINPTPGPPVITTASPLPSAGVGAAYTQALVVSGGVPPYAFSLSGGSVLPAGLTLNPATGVISGTPTTAGTGSWAVQVSDSIEQTANRSFSLTIAAGGGVVPPPAPGPGPGPGPTPMAITTLTLPDATVGVAYGQVLGASGGAPPYTWSISSGLLPPGLSLQTTGGEISGTPTAAGTFTFTVRLKDAGLGAHERTLSIRVNASPTGPRINTGGVVGGGLGPPRVSQISPNAIVSIFGENFAPAGTAALAGGADLVGGRLPTRFGGVCVQIGAQLASIFHVFANQINVQVPSLPTGAVAVQVLRNCGAPDEIRSNQETVTLQAASPEFFYFVRNPDGRNPIVAINAVTGLLVGTPGLLPGAAFVPARPGDAVALFATGFGRTSPSFAAGELPSGIASIVETATVLLGDRILQSREVIYVGVAPFLAGVYQVNLLIPADLPDGDYQVTILLGAFSSPRGGFISIRR